MTYPVYEYCKKHNIINCRECFPSPSVNYRPEPKICEIHQVAGCTECWVTNKDD